MKSREFLMAFAAIAAVSMSSCSQEEELVTADNQLSDNAIAFGTYIGKNPASRGSVINTDALQKSENGFGVMAYYTKTDNYSQSATPNFMYNQQVTYSTETSAWTYSPVKYWPNNANEKISFFAYAPYTATPTTATSGITALSANDAAGDPTLKFVLPENVSDLIDLLYADTKVEDGAIIDVTKPESSATQVKLNFKHALSRVNFQWKVVVDGSDDITLDDNTTVTINEIKFSAMKFGTAGTLNLNSGAWSEVTYSEKAYTLDSSNFIEGKYSLTGSNAKEATNLTGDNGYIMFIPFETGADSNAETDGGTIYIKYTVSTKDSKLKDEAIEIVNEASVQIPAISFTAGMAYNFLLKVGLTSVKLEAGVADWTDGTITNWESITF